MRFEDDIGWHGEMSDWDYDYGPNGNDTRATLPKIRFQVPIEEKPADLSLPTIEPEE